jgi:hypothetical protein
MSLALIALCLTGCATNKVSPDLKPIFLVEKELSCLTAGTKQQLVAHNCKVDYDPEFCPPANKPIRK